MDKNGNKKSGSRKNCLKDFVKKIYGYRIIHWFIEDDEKGKSHKVVIDLGGKTDLAAICTYTDTYEKSFCSLLEYTFIPQNDLRVCMEKNNMDIDSKQYIRNVICNFIGKKTVEELFSHAGLINEFVETRDPLLSVIKNLDQYKGIPVCCSREQLEKVEEKKKVKQSVEIQITKLLPEKNKQGQDSARVVDREVDKSVKSLADVWINYGQILYSMNDAICRILTEHMRELFFHTGEMKQEDEIGALYQETLERIKGALLTELRNKIIEARSDSKQIFVVDKECDISRIDKAIPIGDLIQTECSRVTIPECTHWCNENSFKIPILNSDCTSELIEFPAHFEIFYLTDSSLQLDQKKSAYDIQKDAVEAVLYRNSAMMQMHWRSVIEVIESIFKNIMSIDAVKLIWEKEIEESEGRRWLELFNQTSDNIKKNIQDEKMFKAYLSLIADSKHICALLYPAIGDFASELYAQSQYLAQDIKKYLSSLEIQHHRDKIQEFLNHPNLHTAIKEWDEAFHKWTEYRNEQMEKCTDNNGGWYNDGRLSALVDYQLDYSEYIYAPSGNLFQSLYDALERYDQYLQADFEQKMDALFYHNYKC